MVLLRMVSPPCEGVRHEEPETTAFLDGKGLGSGTLCVAETRVSWFDGSGMGFSVEYPAISLHAISRDTSAHPQEHLYLMVNSRFHHEESDMRSQADEAQEEEEENESSDDSQSSSPITEIRFIPSDKSSLESMFSAMCECQALHPDPDDSDSDFEGDEYDVEEAEQGQHHLPDLYSCEEAMSHFTLETQVMLEKKEEEPSKLVAQQCHLEEETKVNISVTTEAGQSEDASVKDWVPAKHF
ncbi:methylosome subunit pICln-like [Scleropages formosus]|uniref:Methylosome subunit pICln n=1 Tax=Scleropages formosus TaxID=113540 RepID=A0A8C9QZD1_SCLFO|nr:methylosome subunit pICln-like [Scleropages formosus]